MRVLEKPFDSIIHPQGRVTVELFDEDTGKVKHHVKSDNAILTHWVEYVKKNVRGDDLGAVTTMPGSYALHGQGVALGSTTDVNATQTASALDWWISGAQRGNPIWGYQFGGAHQASMRSIIVSDSTEAVDADEFFFPGNINAFCYLPEAYAPSTNTKRATMVASLSSRTPSQLRYVSEWGTAYGNGLHNSVGMGHCTFPATQAQALAMPSLYATQQTFTPADTSTPSNAAGTWRPLQASLMNFFGVVGPLTNSEVPSQSGHWVSNSEIWVLVSGTAGNNLTKMDISAATVRPFSASSAASGVSVTGPTMTTIGASTVRCGVTVIGSDLWLAYTGTLKRCVKPTNTSLTVSNTYTPGGIETLVDITTDGTDLYWLGATTVYKINPATGTITTSWAHGLTGTMYNICYMAKPTSKPRLYISYIATGLTAAVWNGTGGATGHSPIVADSFTVAGTREPGVGLCPNGNASGGQNFFTSALIMPLSTDCKHQFGWNNYNNSTGQIGHLVTGPSHLSRTVLGSPVTKTSANSMRVTYDFGFS